MSYRFRLETETRAPYWIVGDPALNERAEMSAALSQGLEVSRNQQETTGAEWDAKIFHDSGNQGVSYTATTRREFSSIIERMDFIARLAADEEARQEHLWSGDVWLRVDVPGSSAFKEYKIADAIVALAGSSEEGERGLRLTYRIKGGGFSGEAREGVQGIALVADGIVVAPPVIDFWATSVGGDPISPTDPGHTWPDSSVETTADYWTVSITARKIVAGFPVTTSWNVLIGSGTLFGYTNLGALPMTGHLAAIAAAVDPAWVTATVMTISGRQAIRFAYCAVTEPESLAGDDPALFVTVRYRALSTTVTVAEVQEVRSLNPTADITLTDSRDVGLIADRRTA